MKPFLLRFDIKEADLIGSKEDFEIGKRGLVKVLLDEK